MKVGHELRMISLGNRQTGMWEEEGGFFFHFYY